MNETWRADTPASSARSSWLMRRRRRQSRSRVPTRGRSASSGMPPPYARGRRPALTSEVMGARASGRDYRARARVSLPPVTGPVVDANEVRFRLPDRGWTSVRLLQDLERPRNGPPLARRDGVWELAYRRRQVDRMEYRFEADGEAFCDPGNPRRVPGAFGERSVIEFPGYAAPAWLAAPDPAPALAVAVTDHARLWSPPDTDPREPLPLLVAHDGTEYERIGGLTRLIAHAVAAGRLPPCRVAL